MNVFQAIVLGVIQGLTEFLPVSSTGHLRVLPALFGWEDPGAPFTAVIQLGTTLAVLIYFRKDLWNAVTGWIKGLRGGEAAKTTDARMGWAIIIGTIPIIIFGFTFKDQIENQLRSLYVVAWTLIAMSGVMLAADQMGKKKRGLTSVKWLDGLWVGLWQCIALIPGASRSGSTITGALFAGFDRSTAARFSFLLSVPAITAAAIFAMREHSSMLVDPAMATNIWVANIVSFFAGYAAIAFLISFLQRHSLLVFIVYRVLLGILLLVLLQIGFLTPFQGMPVEDAPPPPPSVVQPMSPPPQ
ncbi:MAG: undecaprenyl-diphosphate phosphatase [Fimbriimonadaceae bacterium]